MIVLYYLFTALYIYIYIFFHFHFIFFVANIFELLHGGQTTFSCLTFQLRISPMVVCKSINLSTYFKKRFLCLLFLFF